MATSNRIIYIVMKILQFISHLFNKKQEDKIDVKIVTYSTATQAAIALIQEDVDRSGVMRPAFVMQTLKDLNAVELSILSEAYQKGWNDGNSQQKPIKRGE